MIKPYLVLDSIQNNEASSIKSDADDESYITPNDFKLLAKEKMLLHITE